ncbi:unnamed protein product [Prunus armeniaca]
MAVLTSFATFCVKKVNKVRLAEYIEAMSGVKFWSQYSRSALLFKYIQDEHEACTRRGRNLLSQSLLRPPGSAPEKDQTRLASCLAPSDRLAP